MGRQHWSKDLKVMKEIPGKSVSDRWNSEKDSLRGVFLVYVRDRDGFAATDTE